MTFREDESRVRKDASPENLAIIRHMALNILKRSASGMSLKRKKLNAALDDNFRTTLIQQGI